MLKNCDNQLASCFCYIGNVCGWMSSITWFVCLFPQIIKNYREKDVKGISNSWAAMNFFASLINVIFIYSIDSMPIFSKISAIYMPLLEYIFLLQIFQYHNSNKNVKILYFLLLNLGIFIISALLIYLSIEIKESLTYVEWCSIFLWSFESFPQIHLNFQLSSAQALSKITQFITFFGKSSDILSNYLLIIPYQYRFLGFFSTTNAYICVFQVLFYFRFEILRRDNQKLKNVKNKKKKNVKNIIIIFSLIVLTCCGGTAYGFIYRVDNIAIAIPLLVCDYLFVLFMYFYTKHENKEKETNFILIKE